MSTSKELVELTELYKNIQLQEFGDFKNLFNRNKKTDKDKQDIKKENELNDVLNKLKSDKNDDKDDKEEITGPNIKTNKSNNKSNTVDLTNTTNNKTDNKSNNNEKPPIKVDVKDKDGKVIGHKKIYSASPEYKDASQGKGTVTTPSEMGTNVTGVDVKTGNIIKKDDKKEVKPTEVKPTEVKPETYLGKEQGLLNKADWLKKTANSPAAKAFGNSDAANERRWQTQLKHRQWQKDNNRGKFKVKDNPDTPGNEAKQASKDAAFARRNKRLTDKGLKPITKKVKVEVPSKFAANKEKPTFQRRDQKLLDKGLKPPTYTTKVDVPKVETPKVEVPKVEVPKVEKNKTFKNKITAESYAGKVLAKGTGELAKRVAKKMAGSKDKAPQDSRPDKGPAPSRPDKAPAPDKVPAPSAPSRPKPSTGPSGGESQRNKPKAKPKAETPKQDLPKPHKSTRKTYQESYDAYDLVLNYIMETEQASSIEEANYIMLEMDQNTIHEIVVEQKKTLDEGIKTAVGLGMLELPYAMRQLEKRWNPVKKQREKYQNKKAKEYEEKSGTTKEDGYFR